MEVSKPESIATTRIYGAQGSVSPSRSSHEQERIEIIDAKELARRWALPESWIREQSRARATDPVPCVRFGRYIRFEFGSPQLNRWLERHRSLNSKK
jgi:hypothetical protein